MLSARVDFNTRDFKVGWKYTEITRTCIPAQSTQGMLNQTSAVHWHNISSAILFVDVFHGIFMIYSDWILFTSFLELFDIMAMAFRSMDSFFLLSSYRKIVLSSRSFWMNVWKKIILIIESHQNSWEIIVPLSIIFIVTLRLCVSWILQTDHITSPEELFHLHKIPNGAYWKCD